MTEEEILEAIKQVKNTNYFELNLSDNNLTGLPPDFNGLTELQYLFLDGNQFSKLPPEIAQMTGLEFLHLERNQFDELSPEIVNLAKLQELYLEENQLNKLPPEMAKMTSLRGLYLSKNRFAKFPKEILKMTELRVLHLSANQLSHLPIEILFLKNLEELDIGGNPMEIVEDEKQNAKILSEIADNKFAQKVLSLYFQIEERLIEVFRETPETLIKFIKQKEEGAETNIPLLEGKIVIVGNGNAGKTSLRQRLLGQPYQSEGKTKGVKIDRWEIEAKGETIKLNVWDFGGQEIYHTTHKFFFRSRCVYLLVIDKRAGFEKYLVKYWLRQIKELSENAPLILIFNKSEDEDTGEIALDSMQDCEEMLEEYRDVYRNIKACHFTSCLIQPKGLNIEEVKAEIRQAIENDLPEIFHPYKREFSEIRDLLRRRTDDFVYKNEFEEICKAHGIESADEQKILRTLLDTIGTITSFEDEDVEEIHALKPEWITKGVYKIISSYKLSEKIGEMTLEDIKEILSETHYDGKHKYIIAMMEKFDLCFAKGKGQYFFPAWFPLERKDYKKFDEKKAIVYQYQYRRDASVEKFLSDYIAQNHTQTNTYWRRGIVINKSGARALVKVDSENETITITVEGKVAETFLEDIKNDFHEIHKKYGITVKEEKLISSGGKPEHEHSGHPNTVSDPQILRENEELKAENENFKKAVPPLMKGIPLLDEKNKLQIIRSELDGIIKERINWYEGCIIALLSIGAVVYTIYYWQNWAWFKDKFGDWEHYFTFGFPPLLLLVPLIWSFFFKQNSKWEQFVNWLKARAEKKLEAKNSEQLEAYSTKCVEFESLRGQIEKAIKLLEKD